MGYELNDKVVLVTGGAQGIGEATVQLCIARGAKVVIVDANPRGEAVASQIRASGGQTDFILTDVRVDEQVSAAFEFVRTRYGRLDALVCAAGILKGAFQTPEEMPTELFEMVLDVNVKGVFLCAKYATAMLEASGSGVMVVIASGAGVSVPSSSLAYGASKGGVNGLGMTLGGHLEKRGIRVNVLCPGNIITEMKMSVDAENARRKGENVEKAVATAKLNYGTPDGIAKLIAFMISDEADYLRGTVFAR